MSKYTVPPNFGEIIYKARLKKGWTRVYLACRAGICENAVLRIEKGITLAPHAATAYGLESVLGLHEKTAQEWGRV